jgi:hypothetical protein
MSIDKGILIEHLLYDNAAIKLEEEVDSATQKKSLCMKGIFLQAEVENHNKRIYPRTEIQRAVNAVNEKIKQVGPLPGECAHPEGLEINIDRISHTITEMWMDGNNGMGKLKLLPTPHGNIIKVLLESGVKLGVSSRGSGNVGADGRVYDFDIVTVDIVSQPSAPHAYPQTIYEQVLHAKNSKEILKLAEAVNHDYKAQKFFKEEVLNWFNANLKK